MPKVGDAAMLPSANETPVQDTPKLSREMPSIKSLEARTKSDEKAAELRERGETPTGKLERISNNAEAQARVELAAANTGFVNRVKNFGSKVLQGVKGFFSFLKKDIILPVADAAHDIITGRKESGEAVSDVEQRISVLQQSISHSEGPGRSALEEKLADAEEELMMLRDPHNWERAKAAEIAENERATAKNEKTEATAFMKSEALREKSEAAQKALEMKQALAEREAQAHEARANLGRGALTLILTSAGEDPSKTEVPEAMALAVGAIIQGAVEAVKAPGEIKAGWESAKQELREDISAVKERASTITRGLLHVDDATKLYNTGKEALGASLSLTGAILKNTEVQQEILDYLGQEQELATGDEEGEGAVEGKRGREVLLQAMKDLKTGTGNVIGKAVKDTWEGVRDSEIVEAVTPAAKKLGRGAKYTALGAGALLASPILIPGVGIYFAGKGAKAAYELGTGTASEVLTEISPQLAEVIAPVIKSTAELIDNTMNLKGDAKKEFAKLGADINTLLINTAGEINEGTAKVGKAYDNFITRKNTLLNGAKILLMNLEQQAIDADTRQKNAKEVAALENAQKLLADLENVSA